MADSVERAHEFTSDLVDAFGTDLMHVVLYGSAARGEFRPGRSDLNLLVVLRELNAAVLHRASPLAKGWIEEGNPPPLMFSEAEWFGSADVFAIEYSDIAAAHVVLHGGDPFENVRIRREHLRLQCEHQLRSGHIQLRERVMVHADDPVMLGELLIYSLSSLLTLFRTILRIAGKDVPRGAADVVNATADLTRFDPVPVQTIQEARAQDEPLEVRWDDPLLEGYLAAFKRAAAWIDLG